MEEYVCDSRGHFLGKVKRERDDKLFFYSERRERLGYYDGKTNQTYDFYGNSIGEGNLIPDLLYYPRQLKFPLPGIQEVSFTTYEIKRVDCDERRANSSSKYWDDGRCRICTRGGKRTCHVQGLPGMCEACYRLLEIYSRTDSFKLENESRYRPVTLRQIQKAVEVTKVPFIAASEAADIATKRALVQLPCEVIKSMAENDNNCAVNKNQSVEKKSSGVQSNNKTTVERGKMGKKKKHLRWYHWLFIVLMIYVLINFILPLAVIYILWIMGCL